MDFELQKIGKKWEFVKFLAIFSKSFKYKTMKLGLQVYCGYFQVCVKNGPCGPNFRAVFGPKWGKNMSICRFLKMFCWIHLRLHLQAHWSYFSRCIKDGPQRPKFWDHFGPPNESKLKFSNILLKSFLWIHINLALYAHWSYFRKCVQYGPKGPISGPFWSKLWCLVTFSKILTGFTSVLLHMRIASTFRCVENMGLFGL